MSSRGSESVAFRFRIELHTSRNTVALPLLSYDDRALGWEQGTYLAGE